MMYQEITQTLPVIFKYIMVLYVCRFKINLNYVTEQRAAPLWVRPAIFTVEVIALLLTVSVPFAECFIENEHTEMIFQYVTEFSVCGTIMILSILLMAKIHKKMNYG